MSIVFEHKMNFRVKPRLLAVLGDQLIRDANIAVFELVKNAYDANATHCTVLLDNIEDSNNAKIIVKDDGEGMDKEIIVNSWMVIATDNKFLKRVKGDLKKNERLPLGEKGLGRLSLHKLGLMVKLITRTKNGSEYVVDFDLEKISGIDDFNNAGIILHKREPETFPGKKHGTKLIITKLREQWTRGEVRRLHRAINGLRSPFKGPEDFDVTLMVPQHDDWLKGLFAAEKARKSSLYFVKGEMLGNKALLKYHFQPPHKLSKQLEARVADVNVLLEERKKGRRKSEPIELSNHRIGKVEYEFWLFDRDPSVLRETTDDIKGLKDYLDENSGIRIYRDGIRIYDFGEPGNDWLNLDLRRVNTPTVRISNNQIIGALRLDSKDSRDLREKSNREGLIENKAYEDFRESVKCVLTNVEAERIKDQKRVREVVSHGSGKRFFNSLTALRETLSKKGVLDEVEPKLKDVEKEMEIYRDQLLHAAVPGLSMGAMLHGAEKILEELREAAYKGKDIVRIKELVDRLYRAMRPVTNLLKNPSVVKTSAGILIKEAIFSTELRLKRHEIKLINGYDETKYDFNVKGSKQMLIAAITNLIDNAIHWLDIKDSKQKYLYIGTTNDLEGGSAIVVGDNGTGFGNDKPEDLIMPFFTRRNGGMGLGLYIVDEVMRVNDGNLVFPDSNDIDLPKSINGAVVALQFREAK